MLRLCSVLAACCALVPATLAAQDTPAPTQQPPAIRDLRITGTHEIATARIVDEVPLRVGEPFTETVQHVADRVEELYRKDGYSFARARTEFDEASGVLTIAIDEGVIDEVEFDGVDNKLAVTFGEEFALRPGDVFNSRRARQALSALLAPTRGAIMPGRPWYGDSSNVFHDTRELRERRGTFAIEERDGRRILRVGLREPAGRFRVTPNLGSREDWFTPVDGFVPALDVGAVAFDHGRFNHTFVAGHVSLKTASKDVGYALGIERPFFGSKKLFFAAEVHDLTATDDTWQITSTEASLAAFGPKRSYRDYYRRRGVQLSSTFQFLPHAEAFVAWRGERHESLVTRSDFSLWNDDETFRSNQTVQNGRLNAVLVGASANSRAYDREAIQTTYRRHLYETPFGGRLGDPSRQNDDDVLWRADWTSEISTKDSLSSDFDFRRHIVSGRARVFASQHQQVAGRVIGGWSEGVLPPQRQFAIGGIGSIHGYGFKEAGGDTMRLINFEYAAGWRSGLQLIAFLDAGQATTRSVGTRAGLESPWLKGAGWGIGLGDFRIDFGYPLRPGPSPVQVLLRFERSF